MLDFSARQTELGKTVGDDFRDGKITLPIVIAFARGDAEERGFWRRTLEEGEQAPGDLERAVRHPRAPRRACRNPGPRPRLCRRGDRRARLGSPTARCAGRLIEAAAFATERGF